MGKVTVTNGRLMVDDEPIRLISGELHYWRLDRANWPRILDVIKEMGIKTIASYVPWQHHEITPGEFDFSGSTLPSRDLKGFLEMVKNKGLWLLIRPGPYIYAEWLNAGVPDWVIPYHRLHESFKKAASNYVKAVCEVLREYQATNGGPMIALQADNNIEAWDNLYESQLGLSGGAGPFIDYLTEKYADVAKLNSSWGTEYKDFSEAQGFNSSLNQKSTNRRRYLDTLKFHFWYTNQYAGWIKQCYQDAGVTVPIYLNGFRSINKEQSLADFDSIGDFIGTNLYPSNLFRLYPDEHQKTLEALRYLRVSTKIPYIGELQAGSCHGFHYNRGVPVPNHYRLSALSAILAGVTSWTWFMLVNRDNWMGSPINEWGYKQQELFDVFSQLTRIASTIDLPSRRKLVGCSVVVKNVHKVDEVSLRDTSVEAALYHAGMDYDYFDVERGKYSHPLIFYSGCEWLSKVEQARLKNEVEAGGNLVFFQIFPSEDENLEPLNLLELQGPIHMLSKMYVDHFDTDIVLSLGDQRIRVEWPAPLLIFDPAAGIPIFANLVPSSIYQDSSAEWSGKMTRLACQREMCIGYQKQLGKGSITVLGVKPNKELLVGLHQYFKARIYAMSGSEAVQVGIFEDVHSASYVLVAVNNGQETRLSTILLDQEYFASGTYEIENLINEKHSEMDLTQKMQMVLDIPAKDGIIIRFRKKDQGPDIRVPNNPA